MLRLTEHPGTVPNPRRGEPGQPEDLPLHPELCAIEYQETTTSPWYRVAYASKEHGKPLNLIDTFCPNMTEAQVSEIVDWFVKTTGWIPSKVCSSRLVDLSTNQSAPGVIEFTSEENASDEAALDIDGAPEAADAGVMIHE